MIKPTVGRVVHFYESENQAEPWAAFITGVHDDETVAVTVFPPQGGTTWLPSTPLRQPGTDNKKLKGPWCEWMPYQVKKQTGSESGEKEAGIEEI
jgi:hypothetical protein